jgi:hypothetical protein
MSALAAHGIRCASKLAQQAGTVVVMTSMLRFCGTTKETRPYDFFIVRDSENLLSTDSFLLSSKSNHFRVRIRDFLDVGNFMNSVVCITSSSLSIQIFFFFVVVRFV